MKTSIIERFLLWVMPLSPIETLIMLLINGHGDFRFDSYSKNKIRLVNSIINNSYVITRKFPNSYMRIRDHELLEQHCYYKWSSTRKTKFIISMAIIRIFNVHFNSLKKMEFETTEFHANFVLPTNNILEIFALSCMFSIFNNVYLRYALYPTLNNTIKNFNRYIKETQSSFKRFMENDYDHLFDQPLQNTFLSFLLERYWSNIYLTFKYRFEEKTHKEEEKKHQYQYTRPSNTDYNLIRFFDVLKIKPTKDKEIIKTAYRKLASMYHPDRNSDPQSETKMKDINIAYDTLRQILNF